MPGVPSPPAARWSSSSPAPTRRPGAPTGDSVFYPGTPVLTSFVYSGVFPNGDPKQILATFASVPEPSSLALGLVAIAGSLAWQRMRRRGAKG